MEIEDKHGNYIKLDHGVKTYGRKYYKPVCVDGWYHFATVMRSFGGEEPYVCDVTDEHGQLLYPEMGYSSYYSLYETDDISCIKAPEGNVSEYWFFKQ